MVFYRKYRPQTVSELDLPEVRKKLSSVLSTKELPHAFLFTGSKGLGKTSAARILAKAINCIGKKQLTIDNSQFTKKSQRSNVKGQSLNFEPCNKCDACLSITNGSNIDVLEIDGASNGGVEEIRTLREKVKFSSSGLAKKVYIIDEVHMLSTGAFNALLKTLEEPPSHVVFVLATTELHKLPATVVSRAFQIKFEKPTVMDIKESLQRIVKGEKLDIEGGVLEKIAKMSDGSFRDAAKNLEEVVFASNGKKITLSLFDEVFRTGSIKEEILKLLEAFSDKDAKKALKIIADLAQNGVDFKVVIERMVDHLRGLLMIRNDIESDEVDVKNLSLKDINELLKLSNEAYSEMKISIIPSLPLELVAVKFCILDNSQETEVRRQETEEEKDKSKEMEEGKREKIIGQKKEEEKNAKTSSKNLLPKLIEELNKVNKPGAALLRSAREARVSNGTLVVETPFPIHAERLKSEKVYNDLLNASKSLAGNVELEIKVISN